MSKVAILPLHKRAIYTSLFKTIYIYNNLPYLTYLSDYLFHNSKTIISILLLVCLVFLRGIGIDLRWLVWSFNLLTLLFHLFPYLRQRVLLEYLAISQYWPLISHCFDSMALSDSYPLVGCSLLQCWLSMIFVLEFLPGVYLFVWRFFSFKLFQLYWSFKWPWLHVLVLWLFILGGTTNSHFYLRVLPTFSVACQKD